LLNDPQLEGHMASYIERRKFLATLLGGAAAGWPLAAVAESTTQPIQATTANPPQIEVVRVKPIDPAAPKLRFQLSDESVDLMKSFRLDGFDGVGGAWKMPSTDETLRSMVRPPARFGRAAWQAGNALVITGDSFAVDDARPAFGNGVEEIRLARLAKHGGDFPVGEPVE